VRDADLAREALRPGELLEFRDAPVERIRWSAAWPGVPFITATPAES